MWRRIASFVLLLVLDRGHVSFCSSVTDNNNSTMSPPSLSTSSCSEKESNDHPILCHMLNRVENDMERLAEELTDWAQINGLLASLEKQNQNHDRDDGSSSSNTDITPIAVTETSSITKMMKKNIRERKLDDAIITNSIGSTRATNNSQKLQQQGQLPVVFAHGMGDSCFNSGFQNIVEITSQILDGVYTVCIPTGKTKREDTINGYFMSMNDSIEVFSQQIKNDPNLSGGFHAIGLSQGNNIIRGYIAKYNNPRIHSFISINGINAGVATVPHCRPKFITDNYGDDDDDNNRLGKLSKICELLMEQASKKAYTNFSQKHSFQANYWRDPRKSQLDAYKKYSQLAYWNNEGYSINKEFKENWKKTNKFVWILATKDHMVWPIEGEQWGAPDPENPFDNVLPMNETQWYQKDLFGLRTAEEAGKNYFESFIGDHLQFTEEDLKHWVFTYLTSI